MVPQRASETLQEFESFPTLSNIRTKPMAWHTRHFKHNHGQIVPFYSYIQLKLQVAILHRLHWHKWLPRKGKYNTAWQLGITEIWDRFLFVASQAIWFVCTSHSCIGQLYISRSTLAISRHWIIIHNCRICCLMVITTMRLAAFPVIYQWLDQAQPKLGTANKGTISSWGTH